MRRYVLVFLFRLSTYKSIIDVHDLGRGLEEVFTVHLFIVRCNLILRLITAV